MTTTFDLKYRTLGQYIKGYRRLLNISQEELAEGSGMQKQSISQIENERVNPNYANMINILNYLRKKGAPEFALYELTDPDMAAK